MTDNLAQPVRGYRFADFRLEVAKRRLIGPDATVVPLSGRAYDVLAHLVENRDRVVGKDELIKAVWPHSIVEENNLNQAISVVRRALGDSRDSPRFIVTVAGRGYRFIGDVVLFGEGAAEARDAAAPQPSDPLQLVSSVAPAAPIQAPGSPICRRHPCRTRAFRAVQRLRVLPQPAPP